MKAIIVLFVGIGLGWLANMFLSPMLGGGHAGMEQADAPAEKKPLYWVAPMDKNYRRDGPGKSPMGMDLVPVYEEDLAGGDEN
ncbi:MAG: heavy metal-binding domain-containing protein, partial [Oleiphilaceae bacterium]|nr:heavy metal-binding domain-containing protein [Oleiphilaceae bacterium]